MPSCLRCWYFWLIVILLLAVIPSVVFVVLTPYLPEASHPGFDEIQSGMTRKEIDVILINWHVSAEKETKDGSVVTWTNPDEDSINVFFDRGGGVYGKARFSGK
jgi:hypothetical protein